MRYFIRTMGIVIASLALVQDASGQTITLLDSSFLERESAPYRNVNPDAPESGDLRLCYHRSAGFSVNDLARPLPIDRRPDDRWVRLMFDPLIERVPDRIAVFRPLIASSVTRSEDGRSVHVEIDERARFSDGSLVDAKDIVESLKFAALFDRDIKRLLESITIRSITSDDSLDVMLSEPEIWREIVVAFSEVPIIPAATRDVIAKDFNAPVPSGITVSGAYALAEHDPARTMRLTRRNDYWAQDLPLRAGLDNFENIHLEFYRDPAARSQALLAGSCDLLYEDSESAQQRFSNSIPEAARENLLLVDGIGMPTQEIDALIFNTKTGSMSALALRRAVQRAIERAHRGAELDGLLHPLLLAFSSVVETIRQTVGIDIESRWDGLFKANSTQKPEEILQEAGYTLADGQLLDPSGSPVEITLVLPSWPTRRGFDQIVEKLGINTTVRILEPADYWTAMRERNFDAAQFRYFPVSRYPTTDDLRSLYAPGGVYNLSQTEILGAEALISAAETATSERDFETNLEALDVLYALEIPSVNFLYRETALVSARGDLRWANSPLFPPWHHLDFRTWWRGGEWPE
jgi:peptide/nickel transport system substrate-binding protein